MKAHEVDKALRQKCVVKGSRSPKATVKEYLTVRREGCAALEHDEELRRIEENLGPPDGSPKGESES